MLTYFVEAFLARNRDICSTSILGARRPYHSRILSPGMHEHISTSKCKNHGTRVNSDPDPPPYDSSDSSSLSDSERKKKVKRRKKCRKHRKDDSSDPSSSDDSDGYDSSEDSHYRRRRRQNKKHRKKEPIRLCATLTAKLLTTVFKSKIIRFKLDEDQLQRRIYFLTFIDSLNMIFSKYRETCEFLKDYPKMEGGM